MALTAPDESWELVPSSTDITFLLGGRVVAMGFPGSPRCPVSDVVRELRPTATRKCRIWNLAEMQASYGELAPHVRVVELRFAGHPTPPLIELFPLVWAIEAWLEADEHNVACVHCRTGRGRTNVVLVCLILWLAAGSSPERIGGSGAPLAAAALLALQQGGYGGGSRRGGGSQRGDWHQRRCSSGTATLNASEDGAAVTVVSANSSVGLNVGADAGLASGSVEGSDTITAAEAALAYICNKRGISRSAAAFPSQLRVMRYFDEVLYGTMLPCSTSERNRALHSSWVPRSIAPPIARISGWGATAPTVVLQRVIMHGIPIFAFRRVPAPPAPTAPVPVSKGNDHTRAGVAPIQHPPALGGCRPFLQLFQMRRGGGEQWKRTLFSACSRARSRLASLASPSAPVTAVPEWVDDSDGHVVFEHMTDEPAILCGDVALHCRHLALTGSTSSGSRSSSVTIWRAAFHTGFVPKAGILRLCLEQLDHSAATSSTSSGIAKGPRHRHFPDEFFVDLVFGTTAVAATGATAGAHAVANGVNGLDGEKCEVNGGPACDNMAAEGSFSSAWGYQVHWEHVAKAVQQRRERGSEDSRALHPATTGDVDAEAVAETLPTPLLSTPPHFMHTHSCQQQQDQVVLDGLLPMPATLATQMLEHSSSPRSWPLSTSSSSGVQPLFDAKDDVAAGLSREWNDDDSDCDT